MNERIKELAEQAGFPPARAFSDLSDLYPRLDKFTELILREFAYDCVDVTDMSHHIEFVAKKWGVEL